MEKINYKGLNFEPYITRDEICKQIKRVADEVKADCGDKAPVFLCVLNGAFVFAADLFRACDIQAAEISFIRYKSYDGMSTSGTVKQIFGITEDLTDRTVIIIEDIVDTGITALQLLSDLKEKKPKEVKLATLLFKPDSLTCDVKPDYVGFSIPSKFIIGYGLDLDGLARNLQDIYVLSEDK